MIAWFKRFLFLFCIVQYKRCTDHIINKWVLCGKTPQGTIARAFENLSIEIGKLWYELAIAIYPQWERELDR